MSQLPFDKDAALTQLDGDEELLLELVDIFLEDSPRMLNEIRQAVADSDAEALRIAAHTFKGAVGNFAAEPSRVAAFKLEKIGESGDLSESPSALNELEQASSVLLPELEALKN